MTEFAAAVADYIRDTKALERAHGTNEGSYYPDIKSVVVVALKARHLPFDVRVATSEARERGVDMPDFVLGDTSFTAVFGEVKLPTATLEDMAISQERNDQIGRYLAATGVVLLCNVRGFGLLACRPGYVRAPGLPVAPEHRDLVATVDLWSALSSGHVDAETVERLGDLVERSVTDYAPLAAPSDLAKVLARQARDAKADLPDDLRPIGALLEDFAQALGLSFDLEDPKGDRFFRGSLIQTAFYSLFAGWVLWDRDPANAARDFTLLDAEQHLRIPFIQELFHDLRSPRYLRELDLARHLERAVATLNRVDRNLFRSRMTFPTAEDDTPAISAITYFYEPFLEAFDPDLREELGVWYTPPEIVRYQVRRVHHLLKAELGIARGLAARDVVVLDPCCGTGAYLLEVARCVAEELRADGADDTLAIELLEALTNRIIGFEILTAPFAVAQLQLYVLLADLGVAPPDHHRLAVFLTNALTGWSDQRDVKITFPEMRDEFDASQAVKQDTRVIVVIGNPPYDRFTGAAQAEEAELVAAYKGVRLQIQHGEGGEVLRDRLGNPVKRQVGKSELYTVWGIRKQLLDDLYVRFFRMAEERIGIAADRGIVSFISNSSWLTGRSHPMMRQSIVRNFGTIWIDNLNGDKFKTGKIIPPDLPGAGTRDESAFTTPLDPRGIQPGTAITTLLKRNEVSDGSSTSPTVHYRDFWGIAANKRRQLLDSLPAGNVPPGSDIPEYQAFEPRIETRWRLAPVDRVGGYEFWPALDELFPERPQGVNPNRGLEGSLVDTSRETLAQRMCAYLTASSFDAAERAAPVLATKRARYKPAEVWEKLVNGGGFSDQKLVP
jgi:hypothetical protein